MSAKHSQQRRGKFNVSLWCRSLWLALVLTCTGVPREACWFLLSAACLFYVQATVFGCEWRVWMCFLRERRLERVSSSALCMCVLVCFCLFECGIRCHPEEITPPASRNPLIKTIRNYSSLIIKSVKHKRNCDILYFLVQTLWNLIHCCDLYFSFYTQLSWSHKVKPSFIVTEADLEGFSWCNYLVIVLIYSVVWCMRLLE